MWVIIGIACAGEGATSLGRAQEFLKYIGPHLYFYTELGPCPQGGSRGLLPRNQLSMDFPYHVIIIREWHGAQCQLLGPPLSHLADTSQCEGDLSGFSLFPILFILHFDREIFP